MTTKLLNPHDRQVLRDTYGRAIDPTSTGERAVANMQQVRYIFQRYNLPMDDETCKALLGSDRQTVQTLTRNRALQAALERQAEAEVLIEAGEPATAALKQTQRFVEEAAGTDGYSLEQAYEFLGTTQKEFEALIEAQGGRPQTAGAYLEITDGDVQLVARPGGLRLF